MKFIRVLKADNKESYVDVNRNSGTLVFNVAMDFDSSRSAVKFRQNLPKNDDSKIKMEYDEKNRIGLYKSDSYEKLMEQEANNWHYFHDKELPPSATHIEFQVYKTFGDFTYNDKKDYTNEVEKTRKEILDMFQGYTPNVKVTLVPPSLKTYDYKDRDYLKMQDRVDSLFETLSTDEVRKYDFIIVGKDKAEAEAIRKQYLSHMEEYGRWGKYEQPVRKWDENVNQYETKEDVRDKSWYKPTDMAYIKTVSDKLDNGIYCLSAKAKKYFRDWKGEQFTLIPIYDAKASQLGGKVVIAKKLK